MSDLNLVFERGFQFFSLSAMPKVGIVQVQEAFCRATASRNFFTLEDEATKRLMHGAVVTAYGDGGHIFFEDISLNPFKDTLKVPFVEYRCENQSHVILHLGQIDAP